MLGRESLRLQPNLLTLNLSVQEATLVFLVPSSRIFGLDSKGRDCGDEAAQWFTDFLKTESFRLVQFEKNMKGRVSEDLFPTVVQNYQVSCQRAALHPHQSVTVLFLPPSFLAHKEPPGPPVRKCRHGQVSSTEGATWAGVGDGEGGGYQSPDGSPGCMRVE